MTIKNLKSLQNGAAWRVQGLEVVTRDGGGDPYPTLDIIEGLIRKHASLMLLWLLADYPDLVIKLIKHDANSSLDLLESSEEADN